MGRLIGVLLVMLCCGDGDAFAEDPLVLFFHQRPPYAWADEANTVKGLVAEPAERALRQAGIDIVMLTGDATRTAAAIGRQLSIKVRAELLPEDKQRKFQRISFFKKGYKIDALDSVLVHTKEEIQISLIKDEPYKK